jgi:hypothetical protein
MSIKETERLETLKSVRLRKITLKKASELMGLSYSHTKRLWSQFKSLGPKGLISKKRGRKSNRTVPASKRQEIAKIIADNYYECKPLFISEKLEERHGIKYSSEFIRQLMIEFHLWIPKKAKKNIHQRRERRECEGELVQMDASDEDWLEGRGPRCHLHLLIDDATSKILGAYFAEEETTYGYFRACKPYFEKKGLPISLYNDKRGTFIVNQGKNRNETQFARAMKELGIKMIFAHSPQAKGRIERVFGTLQERLIWEMRIAHISTIEEANKFLPGFLEKHNKKFSVAPANTFNAHRTLNHSQPLKYILCTKEKRKVTKNLEVQYNNRIYQLRPPSNLQETLKKSEIEVLTTLDNQLVFEYRGVLIKHEEYDSQPKMNNMPSSDELLRNWKDKPAHYIPSKDHPWRMGKSRLVLSQKTF